MPLTVAINDKTKGILILIPKGRIDSETYEVFDKKLDLVLEASPKTLVIDMSDVYYISSSGIGVVLRAYREMGKKKTGKVIITNLQPHVRKVFDILKALPDQAVFSSMQEVDKYLDAMQTGETEDEV